MATTTLLEPAPHADKYAFSRVTPLEVVEVSQ